MRETKLIVTEINLLGNVKGEKVILERGLYDFTYDSVTNTLKVYVKQVQNQAKTEK